MTLNQRLKAVRKHSGLNQSQLSQTLGFARSFWNLVENGKTQVTENLLAALELKFPIDPDWVRTGEGQMLKSGDASFVAGRKSFQVSPPNYNRPDHGDLAAIDQEFVFVRRYQVDLSAGRGAIQVPGEDDESIAFTTAFMRKLSINADLCGLVRVKGNSMGQTVPDGSLALVHFAERVVRTEGIYAFNRGEASFIKRLVPLDRDETGQARSIMILGDGIGENTETLTGDQLKDIAIIGRVRAVVTAFG